MGNYISRTMKYGNKVVGIVETYKYVLSTYKTNHMPKYLNIENKKSEVKVQTQNQHIKMYVTKEMNMVYNIYSIYAKICVEICPVTRRWAVHPLDWRRWY